MEVSRKYPFPGKVFLWRVCTVIRKLSRHVRASPHSHVLRRRSCAKQVTQLSRKEIVLYKSKMSPVAGPESYMRKFRQCLNLYTQASRNVWILQFLIRLSRKTQRCVLGEFLCQFTEVYWSLPAVWIMKVKDYSDRHNKKC